MVSTARGSWRLVGVGAVLALALFMGGLPAGAQEPDPTPSPTPSGPTEQQEPQQEPSPSAPPTDESPSPEPSPAGNDEEASSAAAPENGPDASASSTGVAVCDVYESVKRSLEAASDLKLPPCPSDLIGDDIDVNQLVQRINDLVDSVCGGDITTSAGSAASSADTGDCVQMIADIVEFVLRTACDSSDPVGCLNNLLNRIDDLIDAACSADIAASAATSADAGDCVQKVIDLVDFVLRTVCDTTDAVTCVENIIDEIARIIDTVCHPANTGGWCQDPVGNLDGQIKAVCGVLPYATGGDVSGVPPGIGTCVLKVVGLVQTIMITVCGTTNATICVNNLLDKTNDIVANTCKLSLAVSPLEPTGDDAVTTCINKLFDTIDYAMTTVCQSTDAVTCVNNIVDQIDGILDTACSLGAMIPPGELVSTDGLPPGVDSCVGVILGAIEIVMKTVCDSTNPVTCVNNLINQVDKLLGDACGTIPIANNGSVTGELPPGVGTCVIKVISTVYLIMNAVCDSTNPATCVNNLIDRIDSTLGTACGLVPVASSGNTSGIPPGVSTCVVKVLGTVDLVMNTVCQSTNAQTCVDNLITKVNNLLVAACTGGIAASSSTGTATSSSASDLSHPCIDKVIEMVHFVMMTVCQSPDLETCAHNLMAEVNDLLIVACTTDSLATSSGLTGTGVLSPSVTSPSSLTSDDLSHPCVDRMLGLVSTLMMVACQSEEVLSCVENLMIKVGEIVETACSVLAAGESSTPAECVGELIEMVQSELENICGPGGEVLAILMGCTWPAINALDDLACPPSLECIQMGNPYDELEFMTEGACAGMYLVVGTELCTDGPGPQPVGYAPRPAPEHDPVHDEPSPDDPEDDDLAPDDPDAFAGETDPDPSSIPEVPEGEVSASGSGVRCSGDGKSGYRVLAIYAVAKDKASRYKKVRPIIRGWIDQLESYLGASSGTHSRHIRWVCNGANKVALKKVILSRQGDDSFSKTILDLQNPEITGGNGYKKRSRKYLVWVDRSSVLCRGIGNRYADDSPGKDNSNNGRHPMYSRIDIGGSQTSGSRNCGGFAGWPAGWTEIHELWHTLGAVQKSAPHSDFKQNANRQGHCFDEWDLMCYDTDGNGPVTMRYFCGQESDGDAFNGNSRDMRLDCGKDDYFDPKPNLPAKGTYLADKNEYESGTCDSDAEGNPTKCHWNTAWSRFLIK